MTFATLYRRSFYSSSIRKFTFPTKFFITFKTNLDKILPVLKFCSRRPTKPRLQDNKSLKPVIVMRSRHLIVSLYIPIHFFSHRYLVLTLFYDHHHLRSDTIINPQHLSLTHQPQTPQLNLMVTGTHVISVTTINLTSYSIQSLLNLHYQIYSQNLK